MKEINYWKENKKNNVNCKLPSFSAKEYKRPFDNKISTKIKCEDEFFIPSYLEDYVCASVFANLDNKSISIHHFGFFDIDCGFFIEIENGYKACIELDAGWTSRGLILVSGSQFSKAERIKIRVYNLGDKQIIINHKDKIAKIWIEPVYYFDWANTKIKPSEFSDL